MFRIKKLDIFIAKQFGLLFAGTFFISLFVLMMQFLWQYVEDLVGKGLSMTVMAQFFGYMGLMLVPQALPLAVLLSSLITYGNLGEQSELTAIKASGISLLQSFRSLIFITFLVTLGSLYFQNNVGPSARMHLSQLLVSMRQKSPEVEIPEGIFYDGIPQTNLYVQHKEPKTGKLYGLMVYRMTDSYEDAAIILADSGMLQSTAEKKHLLLNLWSGEWFENMRSQQMAGSANVPYRRESFIHKRIVIPFDGDFNLADGAGFMASARTKSLSRINKDIDSLNMYYDSIGRAYMEESRLYYYPSPKLRRNQLATATKIAQAKDFDIDSLYEHLQPEQRRQAVNRALSKTQGAISDFDFKKMVTNDGDQEIRQHKIERINKFTLALSCLIFFFIGAPLGAIIRKGGLGVPIIVAVIVYIVFYILDNTGYRMARGGMWEIWFGKGLSTAVLTPIAIFFTYKANNDSAVFNIDAWRNTIFRMLGLRLKRSIQHKEVIINHPDYAKDAETLQAITREVEAYAQHHKLKYPPNVIKVFFRYHPDNKIARISDALEPVIEDLANTRDRKILSELNHYPILAVKAHTRPFERKWMNITAAIILPAGIFFYFRMWRFRLRLHRDLITIRNTNNEIVGRISQL
ncbi:MAG: LptF/LptG family permease [Prevotella sp.]|nr:LptF/LptG family permease [Prevotella sp.]MBQ6422788.1 LptF/LptG family permease [Prevotella sp.]